MLCILRHSCFVCLFVFCCCLLFFYFVFVLFFVFLYIYTKCCWFNHKPYQKRVWSSYWQWWWPEEGLHGYFCCCCCCCCCSHVRAACTFVIFHKLFYLHFESNKSAVLKQWSNNAPQDLENSNSDWSLLETSLYTDVLFSFSFFSKTPESSQAKWAREKEKYYFLFPPPLSPCAGGQ